MTNFLTVSHTATEVLDHVKRQFGDESGVQITNDDILRWINNAEEELNRRLEFLKATATSNLVAGQAEYDFPSSVYKVVSIRINGYPIERKSYEDAEEYILQDDPELSQTATTPYMWYEWAGKFHVYPVPSAGGTNNIEFRYVKYCTKLTSTTDSLNTPDPLYQRLLEHVLSSAYELDQDWNAAQVKASQFGQNVDSQQEQDTVRPRTYQTITVLPEDM